MTDQDEIAELFESAPKMFDPLYQPCGGTTYVFTWEDDANKESWRADGYRWRQGGSRNILYRGVHYHKKYFRAYDGPGSWSSRFMRVAYISDDHPNAILLQYFGDEKFAAGVRTRKGTKRKRKGRRQNGVLEMSCDTVSAAVHTELDSSVDEGYQASGSSESSEQMLMEPFKYLLQIAGKEIRSKLATAFNYWLNIPEDKLNIIIEMTQMLHNASLLIDDIEDDSDLRRGIPVAHHIYGVAHTINSANYVYFLGLQKALTLQHPQATHVFTEQLLELHRGQGMDIYWRDAHICPTEDEYKQMVLKKTGGLFGLAVKMMQLFSENKCDLKPLLENLGLYFQIRDDYANLNSKELETNKGYAEDLTEGKFSFPIIYGVRSHPENNQIMSILRQKTKEKHVKKYCIDYLESIGAFEYTRQVLCDLEQRLIHQIAELGGNPHLTALIDRLKPVYHSE